MIDRISMGSVAEKLLSYIDTTMVHDNNYQIASIMLTHYRELRGMTSGEIAELCYVSKASISRFCRFLGYEDFRALQDALENEFPISDDYSPQLFARLQDEPQHAFASYSDEAQLNIATTISAENLSRVPAIVQAIHDCTRVAFFSHHFLWDIGRYLQSKLVHMGRYIELYLDYTAQLACAQQLEPGDLAIICSIGGSYPLRYDAIYDAISHSGCDMLVITQNGSSSYWNRATYMLSCGISNRNDTGKYGALAAIDLLVLQYMRSYCAPAFSNDASCDNGTSTKGVRPSK